MSNQIENMKQNKFIKGQKVWSTARTSYLLKYVPPTCATIKYKLTLIHKIFVMLHMVFPDKGDYYCIKTEYGRSICQSEDSITDLKLAIKQHQNVLSRDNVIEESQRIAHQTISSWCMRMLEYQKLN